MAGWKDAASPLTTAGVGADLPALGWGPEGRLQVRLVEMEVVDGHRRGAALAAAALQAREKQAAV